LLCALCSVAHAQLAPSAPHAQLAQLAQFAPSAPHAQLAQLAPSAPHAQLAQLAPSAPERTVSLGVNPLGWMMGFYGISATVALSEHTALRADGTYIRLRDDYQSYEFELGLPIYLVDRFDGLFIEPGLSLRRSRGSAFVSTLENPPPRYRDQPVSHLRGANLLVGWHWMSDSGVNLAVAAGLAFLTEVDEMHDETVEPVANGYLRLGFAL
jgi:hypothetical protein